MRDILNSTSKKTIEFSLCGWYSWYASLPGGGYELGNSWRISGDGTNWGALTDGININAPLYKYVLASRENEKTRKPGEKRSDEPFEHP